MKKILRIIMLLILIISSFGITNAAKGLFDSEDNKKIYLCDGSDCWLEEWVKLVKTSVNWVVTEGTATDHIQKIVIYLLSFITFVAVIYIIYSWFRIQTSSGEDEIIKNSKKTIGYVVVWIVVIWFAWTIANFAVNLWSWWEKITNNS